MRTALRTLLIPQSKSKIKAGDGTNNGTYKFFTSSPVQSKYYHEATYDRPALIFGTGGNASVHFCDEPFSTSTDCLVMYGSAEANLELIYQYLCTNIHILQAGFKGAGLQHISKDYILDIEIDFPDKEKQTALTGKVRKIDHMLWNCRQQLVKLDELVKARFVEMFGDPVQNPMGWQTKPLLEMGFCKNGMNFHTGDSGIKMHCLGVGDFKDFSVIDGTDHLPMISLNETPPDESMLRDGDIVFVRSNGNKALVGRCLVVYPHNTPTTYSGFCIRYRLTCNVVNTTYILHVLKTKSMRERMAGRGANIQNLNQQILASLDIPLPSLDMQEQFAAFVAQTDKSKLAVQLALEKLETLKKSLMQQYFG